MTEPDDRRAPSTSDGRPARSGGRPTGGRPSSGRSTGGSAPRRDGGAGRPARAGDGPRGGSGRPTSARRDDTAGRGSGTGRSTGGRPDDRGAGRSTGGPRRDDRGGAPARSGGGSRDDRTGGPRSGGPRSGGDRPTGPRSGGDRSGGPRSGADRTAGPRTGSAPRSAGDRDNRGRPARSDDRRSGSARPDSGRPRTGGAPRSRDHDPRGRAPDAEQFPENPRLEIPSWARTADLDPSVRSALRSLSTRAAEEVSGHLAAAAEYLDDDPTVALAHARVARSHAARVAVVREAVGIAAYRAGEWTEALSELRAAHRMSGEYYLVPLLMDTERALGRPQAALKLAETLKGKRLDAATRVELAVVTAGVRRDLGSAESALAVLEREDLRRERDAALSVRLWYAYADALESVGRREDAARWFGEAAGRDREGTTDAADRAAGLL